MSEMKYVTRADAEHLDSVAPGAGAFFNRQLEQIESQILIAKRPAKNGLVQFPTKGGIDAGAEFYTRRMYEHLGQAGVVGDYASDLPRVDVSGEEDTVKIETIGASFTYNIQEIAAGEMAARSGNTGILLDVQRGIAARDAIELKLNNIVWNGLNAAGLYGVLNHPYTPHYAVPNASTAATDTVIADIAAVFNSVKNNSNEVEQPKRLLMGAKLRNYLSTRLRTNTDSNILEILAKMLGLAPTDIIGCHELNAAGAGGGDVVIADYRDELVMGHILPVALRIEPVQRKNLAFVVNLTARTGGMMSSYPLGMTIAEMPNAIA